MKILLIDGNSDNELFDACLKRLEETLLKKSHEVKTVHLRDKKIQYCIGCWRCWVKTPGRCFVSDDSHEICYDVIHSDFVLFASPIVMGFTSALLKKLQDKLIPLLHPYIEMVDQESHHQKRYAAYPRLGLLLEKSTGSDDEDIEIIKAIYQRFALNFKSELSFTKFTHQTVEEIVHAIDAF